MDQAEWGKVIGGGFGAFIGAVLAKVGLKRARRNGNGDGEERRGQAEHDKVNRLEYDVKFLANQYRDLERRVRELERS